MDDKQDGFILFLIIAAVATVLFWGVIKGIAGTFKKIPQNNPVDSSQMLREQDRRMDDIRRQQKDLMRQQEQRIRDMSR